MLTLRGLGSRPGEGVSADAVLGYIILVLSYTWRVGGLFDSACNAYHGWFRYPVERRLKSLLAILARRCQASVRARKRHTLNLWLTTYRMVVAVYVPYYATSETLASFSSCIWLSCLGLAFGTIEIYMPRHQVQSLLGANEDEWGFGQIVPLILLCQPLSVVWEHLAIRPASAEKGTSVEDALQRDPSRSMSENTPITQAYKVEQQSSGSLTLLRHLATESSSECAGRFSSKQTSLEEILFGSRLFHINVYLTQLAIFLASSSILVADAMKMKTGKGFSANWVYACLLVLTYFVIAPILSFCLSPWSSLGKRPVAWKSLSDGQLWDTEMAGFTGEQDAITSQQTP